MSFYVGFQLSNTFSSEGAGFCRAPKPGEGNSMNYCSVNHRSHIEKSLIHLVSSTYALNMFLFLSFLTLQRSLNDESDVSNELMIK